MKCTMCRVCFRRMVEDEASECRSQCPVCGQRLLNWMRKQTKDKDDYRGSVNKDLWTAIQQQFKPYNPDGLTAIVTTDTKRILADRGEVGQEYLMAAAARREEFVSARQEEEKQNMALLESIEDEDLRREMKQQMDAMREIELQKERKALEAQDAEYAAKLALEERQEIDSARAKTKLAWNDIVKRQEKMEQVNSDAEIARRLSGITSPTYSKKKTPNTTPNRPSTSTKKRAPTPKKTSKPKRPRFQPVVDIRRYFSSSSSSSGSEVSNPTSPPLFEETDSEKTLSPDELFQ